LVKIQIVEGGKRRFSAGRPTAPVLARYRCFLPDLAGLAGLRRVGPGTPQVYHRKQVATKPPASLPNYHLERCRYKRPHVRRPSYRKATASRNVHDAITITLVLLEIGASSGGTAKPQTPTKKKSTTIRNLSDPKRFMPHAFTLLSMAQDKRRLFRANPRARPHQSRTSPREIHRNW
jgi:hypothetical protein